LVSGRKNPVYLECKLAKSRYPEQKFTIKEKIEKCYESRWEGTGIIYDSDQIDARSAHSITAGRFRISLVPNGW